jgi:hypothetical protein
MRTALLTALLLSSPLAVAQDAPAAGTEEGTEGGTEEGTEAGEGEPEGLPPVSLEARIDACSTLTLMAACEVEAQIGLCQLEPCETEFKDGARACKQCVPYAMKPVEPEPVEPEPMLDADEEKKGKKRRRRKKRDCGCSSLDAGFAGMAFSLPLIPLVIRRRIR